MSPDLAPIGFAIGGLSLVAAIDLTAATLIIVSASTPDVNIKRYTTPTGVVLGLVGFLGTLAAGIPLTIQIVEHLQQPFSALDHSMPVDVAEGAVDRFNRATTP